MRNDTMMKCERISSWKTANSIFVIKTTSVVHNEIWVSWFVSSLLAWKRVREQEKERDRKNDKPRRAKEKSWNDVYRPTTNVIASNAFRSSLGEGE